MSHVKKLWKLFSMVGWNPRRMYSVVKGYCRYGSDPWGQ
jgi:hypothetical protein